MRKPNPLLHGNPEPIPQPPTAAGDPTELIPGYGYQTVPPAGNPRIEAVHERLDRLSDSAEAIQGQLAGSLADRVAGLEAKASQIGAVLLGSVESKLGRLEEKGGKIARKLDKNLDQLLDNAYSNAFALGATAPNVDQIIEGIQGGDPFHGYNYSGPSGSNFASNGTLGPMVVPAPIPATPPTGPIDTNGPRGDPYFPPIDSGGGGQLPGVQTPYDGTRPPIGGPGGTPTNPGNSDPWGLPSFYGSAGIDGSCASRPYQPPRGTDLSIIGTPCETPWHYWFPPGTSACSGHPVLYGGMFPQAGVTYIHYAPCMNFSTGGGGETGGDFDGDDTPPTPPPPLPPPTPQPPPPLPENLPVCAVPAYNCGPHFGWKPKPVFGKGKDYCQTVGSWLQNVDDAIPKMDDIVGMVSTTSTPATTVSSLASLLLGSNEVLLPAIINRIAGWMKKVTTSAVEGLGCDNGKLLPIAITQAALGLAEKWTGAVPDQTMNQLEQLSNTVCQSRIPSPAEADAMFLGNTIGKGEWECYHKAAGNYVSEFQWLLDAKRTKVDALQLCKLFRQKKITNEQFMGQMRSAGVLKEEDLKNIFDSTQAWPGLEDVIRFLVRDVGDTDLVKKFGMEEDFDKKWQGPLIDYAKALGVDDELAKNYWKAHWHIPSYTQLMMMLHRRRPAFENDPDGVTIKDVEEALKQDDYLPYWIPHLIAIAYRPLTRTDAAKGYDIRALKDEELKASLMDEGYNETDADKLMKIYDRKRQLREIKQSGLPTARTLSNQFARGEITESELEDIIEKTTVSDEEAQARWDSAHTARDHYMRVQMMKGIKKAFILGIYDQAAAHADLVAHDVDADAAWGLINVWRGDALRRGKVASAAQLCRWREKALITPAQQAAMLVNQGWSQADTVRIVKECDLSNAEKLRAREERQIKEAIARAEKEERKAERERKDRVKAANDAAKEAARTFAQKRASQTT